MINKNIIPGDAQHSKPIWVHKADFVISADITSSVFKDYYASEQLAARQIDDYRFELCCIPFFIYDLFLGDIVVTNDQYTINEVVQYSGHLGYRIATSGPVQQNDVIDYLIRMGLKYEIFSYELLSIDVFDKKAAQELCDYLDKASINKEILDWEAMSSS